MINDSIKFLVQSIEKSPVLEKNGCNYQILQDVFPNELVQELSACNPTSVSTKKLERQLAYPRVSVDYAETISKKLNAPLHFVNSTECKKNDLKLANSIAKKFKIPVIYASSCAVYGNNKWGNDKASDNIINILSPYAQDKYTIEKYAKIANEFFSIKSIGLRFFNVYGPNQKVSNPYSGVIPIFINKAKKNKIPFGVMTFEPVPVMFFNKKIKNHRINSLEQKKAQLKKFKLDFLIIIIFIEICI